MEGLFIKQSKIEKIQSEEIYKWNLMVTAKELYGPDHELTNRDTKDWSQLFSMMQILEIPVLYTHPERILHKKKDG